MNDYELLVIFHPEVEQAAQDLTAKLKKFIESKSGQVTNVDDWGKKKLAYPIKKQDSGYYVVLKFSISGEALSELEREIGLMEEIIRFMIVKDEYKNINLEAHGHEGKEGSGQEEIRMEDLAENLHTTVHGQHEEEK